MDERATPEPPSLQHHFLADHRRLERLLHQVLEALENGDGGRAIAGWDEFADRLLEHMQAEDNVVVPFLLLAQREEARALLEEHRRIRLRLAEISSAIKLHKVRVQTVWEFSDELRAHAVNEAVLYRWADEAVDTTERAHVIGALRKPLPA